MAKFLSRIAHYKTFIANAGMYSLSNVLDRLVPFILLPILTRLLNPADLGIVGTFTALTVSIQPFVTLGSSGAIQRAYFDREKPGFDYPAYLFSGILINCSLLVLAACILVAFSKSIPSLNLFDPQWIFLLFLFIWGTAMWSIRQSLWVMQKNSKTFTVYRFAKLTTNAILSVLLIITIFRSWKGRVIGIALTEVIFGMFAIWLVANKEHIRISLRGDYIKDILKYGFPLLPHTIGWMLITTVDKYFLNSIVGVAVTGIYTVGYTIGSILNIFVAPIDLTAGPMIYEILGKPDEQSSRKLVKYVFYYFAFLMISASIIWMFSPIILRLFIDPTYHGAKIYVPWIAFGFAAHGMYRLVGYFIAYSKKTYYFALITLTSGIVAVIANYTLIRINGSIGAAQATCIAYSVSFLLTFIIANKLYPMPWVEFLTQKLFKHSSVSNR